MKPRTVGAILRRHAGAIAWLAPLALLEVGLDGGLTLSYRYLIDRAIVPHDARALTTVLVALAAGVVVASLASIARDRAWAKRAAAMLDDVRVAVFDHVQALSIGFFARAGSGDVTARFSTDLAGVEAAIVSSVGAVLLPAFGVLLGVALLFVVLDWKMALVAALVWPIVLVGPRVVAPRAADAAYEKKRLEASLLVRVEEAVAAQRTIKAFGLEGFGRARFVERLSPLSRATSRGAFLSSLVERTTVVTIYAVQVGAVAAGAILAYRREVSVGALVSFLTIFWNLGWSLVVIGRATPALVSAAGSARRIDELLAEPTDPADAGELPSAPVLTGAIAAEDVTFSYDGKHPALLFASFAIATGQSVAFVGPSGSGKSTALSLVARFYDPSKGRVTFDGVDGRTVSAASLRAQMGFVMQESFLFDTSIRENIRLGRTDATDAEVEAAARDAEIHDTIVAMPEGYETVAGERGGRLSGGQRQRVAIARALLRKPRILLLDEASSALDPISEAAINATLARVGVGRTTIAVTHRLAGAASCDRIFVVSEHRIVESGTHAELLAKRGVYAELWNKQSGFSVSADGASATVSVERLRAIALLAPLADDQLAALAKILACQRATAGQRVITQGEPGSLFYLVARGVVRVTRHGDDGEEVEIARLDDGDQFGELALLRDAPRSATVTCLTDCVFLTLTRDEFLQLLATSQEVRARVERVAGERRAALRGTSLAMTLH